MDQFNEKLTMSTILKSPNLAKELSEETCTKIGNMVYDEWSIDKQSRSGWETKMKNALDLALQVAETKTFPWSNASNIKFPIITVAALQFHARAYPSLISGIDVVKCRTISDDPEDEVKSLRIAKYMSYQILEEDEAWEDHMDKVLITLPIIGSAFKKSYFDPAIEHNVSENILAKDIYIPYFASSLEKAARITQIVYLSHNEMRERIIRGVYKEYEQFPDPQIMETNILEEQKQNTQQIIRPDNDPDAPYELLEQHRYLDLDGDGYREPYIVIIRKDTKQVMRIVARFYESDIKQTAKGKIYYITPTNYFTKYSFIPSPDGGIYDLGFGILLGPLNESINTLINQLVDAGTLSNTAGGFLGRGAKIRSGDNSFRPFEWKRVDSTGDDLKKSVFPLPVREPSAVLFNLLGLLIDYGERVAMATDPQVGVNPGQNTPAETSRNMISEGQRVFNGIFKRTYRAFKEELQKLYLLNKIFLTDSSTYETLSGEKNIITREDFVGTEKVIRPAADPIMVSDGNKLIQAELLKKSSMVTPGYNKYEVEKIFLKAIHVQEIDKVYPDPKGPNALPQTPDVKLLIEERKAKVKEMDITINAKLAIMQIMAEADLNKAKIRELEAKTISILEDIQDSDTGNKIALFNAQIGAAKAHQEGLLRAIELFQKQLELRQGKEGQTENAEINTGGMGFMEARPYNVRSMEVSPSLEEPIQ